MASKDAPWTPPIIRGIETGLSLSAEHGLLVDGVRAKDMVRIDPPRNDLAMRNEVASARNALTHAIEYVKAAVSARTIGPVAGAELIEILQGGL